MPRCNRCRGKAKKTANVRAGFHEVNKEDLCNPCFKALKADNLIHDLPRFSLDADSRSVHKRLQDGDHS